jgi:chromosome segregation ATPase
LARALWIKASEAASEALSAERAENRKLVERAHDLTLEYEVKAIEANERAEAVSHELNIAREAIRRLEESLAEMRTTSAAIEERHAGQLQSRDERIASLTADFARKEADYAARIAELDGVRKHALRQIDDARTESRHWKSEFDRVDAENKSSVVTYRQRASALDAELAGVRGRLGAVEESLAASRQRCVQLESELAAAHGRDAVTRDAVPRRIGAGRVRGGVPSIKRRKL